MNLDSNLLDQIGWEVLSFLYVVQKQCFHIVIQRILICFLSEHCDKLVISDGMRQVMSQQAKDKLEVSVTWNS